MAKLRKLRWKWRRLVGNRFVLEMNRPVGGLYLEWCSGDMTEPFKWLELSASEDTIRLWIANFAVLDLHHSLDYWHVTVLGLSLFPDMG